MTLSYDNLSASAERGEITVKPGTILRGAAARRRASEALLDATGASNTEEATEIALGRPRLGRKPGPSPTVRARVTPALKKRVEMFAEQEHRAESDIVRDAIAEYLDVRMVS
ncbi:MAG: ribbon-helix-helix protein, CopG family [Leucobacter sp.]